MRRLKAVLVCLLVLAFPLRAYAGWAMAFCGMGHHGAAQTLALQGGLSKDHPAVKTQGDAPCAGHSGGAADAKAGDAGEGGDGSDVVGAGDAAAPDSAANPSEKHQCSACASCCSAAMLLPALPVLLEPDFVRSAFAAVLPRFSAVTPEGLERPPRRLHA